MDFFAFLKKSPSKLVLASLILLICIISSFIIRTYATDTNSVSSIKMAEDAVTKAYQAIYEIKFMGGEVKDLVHNINLAVSHLDKAQFQHQQGNLSGATHFAYLCYQGALEVIADASDIRYVAIAVNSRHFWLALLESAIASCIIVCTSLFFWQVFVQRYYRKILKMRPGAGTSES